MTRAAVVQLERHGLQQPDVQRPEYLQQATLTDPKQRQALIWKMEAEVAHDMPYFQLVDEDLVTAHDLGWTGFYPDGNGYCKCYYTSPHRT